EEEVGIVARRVADLGAALGLPAELDALAEIRRVVTVFRELRSGTTADGRTVDRRGHLGGDERCGAGHPLRGRGPAGRRRRRRPDRRGGQGPGAGRAGLGRVPRDRGPGAGRLGRPLPRLPGPGLRPMADVAVLGVRHHGPGSARAVGEALAELQPDAVLIEGAPELDGVAALAGRPDMSPPVAGLVYAVDEPKRSAFYPLADF